MTAVTVRLLVHGSPTIKKVILEPWTGEYSWPSTDAHIYEYACHEANYAMGGILSGARMREKDEAEAKAGK